MDSLPNPLNTLMLKFKIIKLVEQIGVLRPMGRNMLLVVLFGASSHLGIVPTFIDASTVVVLQLKLQHILTPNSRMLPGTAFYIYCTQMSLDNNWSN